MEHLGDFVQGVMADAVGTPGYDPGPVARERPDMTSDLLQTMLRSSVPAFIDMLMTQPPTVRIALIKSWSGKGSATNIGTYGDQFLYGGKNAGSVFDDLAKGLAVLSTSPGGVTAFGLHFCASHCPQGRVVEKYTICEEC